MRALTRGSWAAVMATLVVLGAGGGCSDDLGVDTNAHGTSKASFRLPALGAGSVVNALVVTSAQGAAPSLAVQTLTGPVTWVTGS